MDRLSGGHGPDALGKPLGLKERLATLERGLGSAELTRCQSNQSEAARRLSISRPALIDKLRK